MRGLFRSFAPFPNQVVSSLLSSKNYWTVLDNDPFPDVSFANIFLWSVACLLILPTVPFPEQKLLISMNSSLSIIPFMDGSFGVGSPKSSPHLRSSRFFSFVPPRSLRILHFPVSSVIYALIICVKAVRAMSRVTLHMWVSKLSSASC